MAMPMLGKGEYKERDRQAMPGRDAGHLHDLRNRDAQHEHTGDLIPDIRQREEAMLSRHRREPACEEQPRISDREHTQDRGEMPV